MNSSERLRVGLMFGGRSGEHAVSLMSAVSILAALRPEKYDVIQIGITQEGHWLVGPNVLEAMTLGETDGLTPALLFPDPTLIGLQRLETTREGVVLRQLAALDVVFPVLHGTFGEDGTLQGLLELAGVAYVGAGVLGSALAMDKGVFKDIMHAHAIPVLEAVVVSRREIRDHMDRVLSQAEALAPYPLFTKPANLGSSVGVSKIRNRSDLMEGLMEAAQYDRRVLIERGLEAREIEISVLGNERPEASVLGEIRPAAEFYTYNAKYHDDRSELIIPAPVSREISDLARSYAVKAFRAIDCAGMARVDFLLEKGIDRLYLSEINTIPGFTRISMYPKLWEASGLAYPDLVDRLIELALERRAERARTQWKYVRGGS